MIKIEIKLSDKNWNEHLGYDDSLSNYAMINVALCFAQTYTQQTI